MMNYKDAYSAGARAGRQAIAHGFPRWMHTSDCPFGEMIDPDTGLPLLRISGSAELVDTNAAIVRGYNETIVAGIKSGEVTVDFRPLLMSRPEVLRALEESRLGILSTDNPRIEASDGGFVLQLRFPKQSAKRKLTWISYSRADEEWPDFALYDAPVEIAVGRNGRVLIFRSSCLLLTRDVVTTQVLNAYPL